MDAGMTLVSLVLGCSTIVAGTLLVGVWLAFKYRAKEQASEDRPGGQG